MASKKKAKKNNYPLRAVLALALALVGYLYYQRQVSLRPKPLDVMEVTIPSGMVDLSFASADSQNISLMINTGSAKVSATQIEISYDAQQLGTPKVTVGDFFALKLGEITVKDGLIKAVVAVPLESGGKLGTGNALTLVFPQKPTTATKLAITGNTMVAAVGYDYNVLKNVSSLTLTPAAAPVVSNPAPPTVPTTSPTQKPVVAATKVTPPARPTNTQVSSPVARELTPTNFGSTQSVAPIGSESEVVDTSIPNQSLFARFISWIKLIFNR